MKLDAYVSADLLKLKERLAKQGVADLTAMDYSKYLQSTLWIKIREWVFQRDKFSCVVCLRSQMGKNDEFDVHHRSYDLETLEGKRDGQLITLCRKCHKKIEYYANGEKRTCLIQKEKELKRLTDIHEEITLEGMRLKIISQSKKSGLIYKIEYIGKLEYLEFYPLERLMCGFTFGMYLKFQQQLRLPLPFRSDKFRQKSGASLFQTSSNRKVINIWCNEDSGLIKVTSEYAVDAEKCLLKAISDEYWRIEGEMFCL